jgi:hypothetical protein
MAAADNNVRPKRQASAVTARRARPSVLARLLLSLLKPLQLDRKLLPLFVASLMPACIIPVGPEWQDPPGRRNSPPTVLSAFPMEGSTVVGLTDGNMFRVTPTDSDVGDNVFVRWLTEFPGFMQGTTMIVQTDHILPGADGTALQEVSLIVTCLQLSANRTTHQIYAAVSDSAFVSSDNPADVLKTKSGVAPQPVVWTLEKACSGSGSP